MESILVSIKKLLGIDEFYEHFDMDILILINAALFAIEQMGVGKENFAITGKQDLWEDFIEDGYEAVKMLVFLKVKIAFDPPSSSFVLESYNAQIAQLEWRLFVKADNKRSEEDS